MRDLLYLTGEVSYGFPVPGSKLRFIWIVYWAGPLYRACGSNDVLFWVVSFGFFEHERILSYFL